MAQTKQKRETYTDLEDAYQLERGKYQEDRRSKITRVNRVYNLFNELSYAEKDQFILLIKNQLI